MIVLKILAVIALVIIALLALNLTFIIAYENEFSFSIKVLFFRFKLFPKKKKKIKPGDYSPEAIEKRKKKEEAKKAKKEAKKAKKEEKKKKKAEKKKKDGENKEEGEPGKKKKTDIPALINMIKNIASAVFERFPKYLKVNIKKLYLSVGTDDAAKTATTYGAVTAALPLLLEFINNHAKLKQYKKDAIKVVPDFVSGQSGAQVDIRISIRVISVVIIGIAALKAFLKSKDEQKEKELRKKAFEKRVSEIVEKWEKEYKGEGGENPAEPDEETVKEQTEDIKEETTEKSNEDNA